MRHRFRGQAARDGKKSTDRGLAFAPELLYPVDAHAVSSFSLLLNR
jgi:hypothetical protein